MKPHIGHIGIVVNDAQNMVSTLCAVLGLPLVEVHDNTEKHIRFAVIDMGGVGLEIIEDYNQDGKFSKFNREHGNAVHHFCILSDTIEQDIKSLEDKGITMVDKKSKIGLRGKKIAFTAEAAINGLTLELSED